MSNPQDVRVLIAEDDCLSSEMLKGLLELDFGQIWRAIQKPGFSAPV
jgi:hypothetical protein